MVEQDVPPDLADAVLRAKNVRIIKATVICFAVALVTFLAVDGLVYAYQWGRHGQPEWHLPWVAVLALGSTVVFFGLAMLTEQYPDTSFDALLYIPTWSSLEPYFKGSRAFIHIVVLSYVLFYVTQGVDQGTGWAVWVNEHIFHFLLFCQSFKAIDVIQIEIAGYVAYLVLQLLYSLYCPQILAHSIRKKGGLPREDAALVFVETVERHGANVKEPPHLANVLIDFAGENRGALDAEAQALMDTRIVQLRESADQEPPVAAAVAGDATAVARIFPASLATQIYYLGKDTFDILYPGVRAILCVGLFVAVVATSLPVVAKLVWVLFPRLGEPCMVDYSQLPPNFRDSEWIEFEGRRESQNATQVVLIPDDNHDNRWTLARSDVAEFQNPDKTHIVIHIGAEVSEKLPPNAASDPPVPASRMSLSCGTKGSRCSNKIEICCGSNTVVGRCHTRWACPP